MIIGAITGIKEMKSKLNITNLLNELGVLLGLISMGVLFSIFSKHFFTVNNLLTIALQTSIIAILAMGVTYVIITSGIDLSVGSILAVSGVVTGKALLAGLPIWLSILLGIGMGGLCGLINGVIISNFKIAPFIVTLGMMSIARGAANVITGAMPVSGLPQQFAFVGGGRIGIVPVPVIIMFTLAAILGYVLKRTSFGRYIYCLGSNEEAALLSGVNVKKTKIGVYVISGLMAGLAGVIMTSRLVSAQSAAGLGYELDAIAAAIIGGCSPLGGAGKIRETIIGAFIIGTMRNGLNLLSINAFWQQIAIGAIIIIAVYIDTVRRRKES
ncbi:ribose transport system permease protein [Natronincola peptidivorans]|uniref:Ribose transport system permease protein n=1 Tax=Natronincola peptidivorans TaxID=426128 RepID=A0A1I0E669_9FIRM|nr:ABC transporter permease [Natronincola peptidivorans]SET40646.1 ribose transport system permease protein [Natronincola peptidivorans]